MYGSFFKIQIHDIHSSLPLTTAPYSSMMRLDTLVIKCCSSLSQFLPMYIVSPTNGFSMNSVESELSTKVYFCGVAHPVSYGFPKSASMG